MPSTMDKYAQGFQLGQSILGQRRQRSTEEEQLRISGGHLNVAQQKLWNLMNQPPESPYGKLPWYAKGAEPGFTEDYRDKLMRLVDPQLSQMQQWLTDNPGKTVEDYLRVTKAISQEFKEPKVPYRVEKTLEEKEKREKEIKAYAKAFSAAWYKRTQEIKAEEMDPITKENFWRGWKVNLPKGDFRADILAKEVAKQVGIKSGVVKRITPAGVRSEMDEFIRKAKGREVDWEAVKGDYPEWDFDYIFEQLGLSPQGQIDATYRRQQ